MNLCRKCNILKSTFICLAPFLWLSYWLRFGVDRLQHLQTLLISLNWKFPFSHGLKCPSIFPSMSDFLRPSKMRFSIFIGSVLRTSGPFPVSAISGFSRFSAALDWRINFVKSENLNPKWPCSLNKIVEQIFFGQFLLYILDVFKNFPI